MIREAVLPTNDPSPLLRAQCSAHMWLSQAHRQGAACAAAGRQIAPICPRCSCWLHFTQSLLRPAQLNLLFKHSSPETPCGQVCVIYPQPWARAPGRTTNVACDNRCARPQLAGNCNTSQVGCPSSTEHTPRHTSKQFTALITTPAPPPGPRQTLGPTVPPTLLSSWQPGWKTPTKTAACSEPHTHLAASMTQAVLTHKPGCIKQALHAMLPNQRKTAGIMLHSTACNVDTHPSKAVFAPLYLLRDTLLVPAQQLLLLPASCSILPLCTAGNDSASPQRPCAMMCFTSRHSIALHSFSGAAPSHCSCLTSSC